MENRLDGAFGHTRFAIDAMERVNVKHRLSLVETVARADNDAIGMLAANTRFGNDKRHEILLWTQSIPRADTVEQRIENPVNCSHSSCPRKPGIGHAVGKNKIELLS